MRYAINKLLLMPATNPSIQKETVKVSSFHPDCTFTYSSRRTMFVVIILRSKRFSNILSLCIWIQYVHYFRNNKFVTVYGIIWFRFAK